MKRVRDIAPREAAALVEAGAVVVDIREAAERKTGVIPGAYHAPLSALDAAEISTEAGRPIIFHCKSGGRTKANAAALEQKAGASDVYILAGGIDAWRDAGLPIECPK